MRFLEIDAIKAIAIIGVMVAHMSFESRFDEGAMGFVKVVQVLLGWCVLAFFFCSGLLANPIKERKKVARYIQKRFIRLVVPCVVFSITYRVIRCGLYLTGQFGWESPIPESIGDALSFILIPVGPQFYFLYYLFAISVGVALLNGMLSLKYIFLIFGIALLVFYGFMELSRAYGPELVLAPLYGFSYVFGMASADKKLGELRVGILCLLPVVAVVIITRSLIVGYVVVPYLLWLLFRRVPLLARSIAKTKLGEYSPAIYVWHAPIIMPLVSMICVKLLGNSMLVLVPVIGCTLLCCILLGEIVVRFNVLRLWRF